MKRYLYSLWLMGRPLFLMGTVPLYTLGMAAAWHDGKVIRVPLLVSGLFLVWLIQLLTHYNNEYCDLETDLATEVHTLISGGSGALVRRLVPRVTARIAAVTCLLLAVALAAVMIIVLDAGVWLLGFVGAAAFFGWFYSGRPLKLESAGLGETVIVVVSCFLLPLTSYYLQTSTVSPGLSIASIPLGLLTFALILTTEAPDFNGDRATGKKTLVVRLGIARTKWLLVAVLAAGWLAFAAYIIYLWPFWGWISVAVSVPFLAAIGLSLKTVWRQYPVGIEQTGLIVSLLLGYAAISLTAAFFIR